MVKIQNYDPYETDIKFDVEEGDVTVKTGFADLIPEKIHDIL